MKKKYDENERNESNKELWDLKRKVNLVFKKCWKFPPNDKAHKYLTDVDGKYQKFLMTSPPVRPKGGEIFLYKDPSPNPNKKVSITDQYRWQSSIYRYLKSHPTVKRQKYYAVNYGEKYLNTNFKRYVYFENDKSIHDRIYLIAYIGNHKSYKEGPHGNRKHNKNREFIPSHPDVLKTIEKTNFSAKNLYMQKITEQNSNLVKIGKDHLLAYEQTHLPRDTKQMENKLYNLRIKEKISRDDIFNLYEIGINLETFIKELKLLPELQVISGYNFLIVLNKFHQINIFCRT